MSVHLREAIEALDIEDVYILKSSAYVREGFDPKYNADLSPSCVQFKHMVEKSAVLNLSENEGTEQQNNLTIFRVYVSLGARWIPLKTSDDNDNDSEPDAQIEATYIAEYAMSKTVPQEALDAFALKNASYHIWPYWREFLMNQCLRMNLPKVALPTVQLAKNRNQSST